MVVDNRIVAPSAARSLVLNAKRKARTSIILGTSFMLAFGSAFGMSRKAPLEDIDYGCAPTVAVPKAKTAGKGSANHTDSAFVKSSINGKSIKSKGAKSAAPKAHKAHVFKAPKKAAKGTTEKALGPFVTTPLDVLSVSQDAVDSVKNASTAVIKQAKPEKAKTAVSKKSAVAAKAKTKAAAKNKAAIANAKSSKSKATAVNAKKKQTTKGKTAIAKAKSRQAAKAAVVAAGKNKPVKNAVVKSGSKAKSKSVAIAKTNTKTQKHKAVAASNHNQTNKKIIAAKKMVKPGSHIDTKLYMAKIKAYNPKQAIAASAASNGKTIALASKPIIKTDTASINKIKAKMMAEKRRHLMKAIGFVLAGISASFLAGWALSGRLSGLVRGFRRKIALRRARNIVMSYAQPGKEKPQLKLIDVLTDAIEAARWRYRNKLPIRAFIRAVRKALSGAFTRKELAGLSEAIFSA